MSFYTTFDMNEGTTLNTGVGDQIRALIVDNYSNSWMYIPACNRYVPPNRHGFIATYLSASQQVLVQWSTPPNFTAPATDNTGTATIVATDDRLGQSNGTTLTQPQEQTLLGSNGFTENLAAGGTFTVIAGIAEERITVYGWTFTINPAAPTTFGNYHIYLEDAGGAADIADGQLGWYSDVGNGTVVIQGNSSLGIPITYGSALRIRNDATSAGNALVIGAVQYIQQ